jgi:hypothetical protein
VIKIKLLPAYFPLVERANAGIEPPRAQSAISGKSCVRGALASAMIFNMGTGDKVDERHAEGGRVE